MITFTVSQINSALENVSQSMAERIRYVMPLDINNTGEATQCDALPKETRRNARS